MPSTWWGTAKGVSRAAPDRHKPRKTARTNWHVRPRQEAGEAKERAGRCEDGGEGGAEVYSDGGAEAEIEPGLRQRRSSQGCNRDRQPARCGKEGEKTAARSSTDVTLKKRPSPGLDSHDDDGVTRSQEKAKKAAKRTGGAGGGWQVNVIARSGSVRKPLYRCSFLETSTQRYSATTRGQQAVTHSDPLTGTSRVPTANP